MGFQCDLDKLTISFQSEEISTVDDKCMDKLKRKIRRLDDDEYMRVVKSYKWQGVIMKLIVEDTNLMKNNFYWLSGWKTCPTSIVSEVMGLIYQTLDTKCYKKHCGIVEHVDTLCRICKSGNESVKHILSNCEELAKKAYKDRHDSVLKCFFFEMLLKHKFIDTTPKWYSP